MLLVAAAVSLIVSRIAAGLLTLATGISFLLYLFDKAPFMWALLIWAVVAWVLTLLLVLAVVLADD